jgi:hypothetical protein
MAFALAIACGVVAAEFSSALVARSRHYQERLHKLSSNIITMRGKIAHADREIAGMRNAAEVDDSLKQVLAEPDSRLIRLEAPGGRGKPTGVIVFSPGLMRAAIEISGLTVAGKASDYTIWWERGARGPFKAAQITVGPTGEAALVIAVPLSSEPIEGAIVTGLADPSSEKPAAEVVLKGAVMQTPASVVTPGHKAKPNGG